jgi:hypothetical protein
MARENRQWKLIITPAGPGLAFETRETRKARRFPSCAQNPGCPIRNRRLSLPCTLHPVPSGIINP